MTTTTTPVQISAPSLAALFLQRVESSPDKEAFRYLDGGNWVSVSWREAADRVQSLAAGLLALGVEPEQRVGIASSTRYEWILADLAVMCAGAATTTVYANTNAADTAYILSDSESRVVFAENADQLAKLTERRAELPDVDKVVVFEGTGDGDWVMTLDDLADLGVKYLERTSAVCPRRRRRNLLGSIGDVDLHLGDDRATQGRAAAARGMGVRRGWPFRSCAILERGRPAVALAAVGARVREGIDIRANSVWFCQRRGWAGRQDRAEHGGDQTDVHGRCPTHLRESALPCRHGPAGAGRLEGEAVPEGLRRWERSRPPQARRTNRSRCR